MLDIKISLPTLKKWEDNLSVLSKVSGCDFRLYALEDNRPNLILGSEQASEDKLAGIFTRLATDTCRAKEMTRAENAIGIPVCWFKYGIYGALVVTSESEAISQDIVTLCENLVSQIEKDLSEEFRYCSSSGQVTEGFSPFPEPDFQSFIDCFEDHLWIKNLDGVYTHCNKPAYQVWASDLEGVLGKTDHDLFDNEIADKFIAADMRAMSSGKQIVTEECSDARSEDNNTWLETIKAPVFTKSGELSGIVGMTRNVTGRKQVEEQLVLAGMVFENSMEGVVITDKFGNIAYVNNAFSDITGYSQEDVVGRNPRLLKSGRHNADFYQEMWGALNEQGYWKGEIWNRRKDGAIYPSLSTVSVVYDADDEPCNYVAVFVDISLQKQNEAELTHMAYHDPLTDLPNRQKLTSQVEHEIYHAKRHGGKLATIFIDIDHFKHINDTFGHLIGDEVLCELADRLSDSLREEDIVSRIGGDEFVILASGVSDVDSVTSLVGKLMSAFDDHVELSNGEKLRITGSMGISLYPDDGEDSHTLLRNADAAMYRAKQDGRNNFAFYTQALTEESESHLKLQGAMHDALDNEEFYLVYQPQFNTVEDKLTGFEALIRWNQPNLGKVPPSEFIPLAEKSSLISDIGQWVLYTACSQAASWLRQGYDFGRVAVNVAGPQLKRVNFARNVEKILELTGLPADYLEIEVTESSMMEDFDRAIEELNILKEMGVEIAIDDFGTGHSSLSYLHKLPLNKIKIDREFITNIRDDKFSSAVVNAIIALGRSLSMRVIAEGIETQDQLEALNSRGLTEAQGFLLGRPARPEELTELLESRAKITNLSPEE
ncbi:EAL domain-containing protein [Vibrio sp. JC009]|uniref:sensor domain-containing protein n=1 Tax=Vibrio sp. JC009 TaxID=2912314 RepID=UPI0023B07DD2|nr:bifunctional diguanylate cyclase/phosphodiesterase [Vibrio sp. JC009]WED23984.1 EAL domain-containing protein [Vibrio sp. JC009]